MPAAWIAAGSAAVGAVGSLSGSSGGQAAQGAANIAGGALSYQEAQQFANQVGQTANPFGQYNSQFASQLAGAANSGQFGLSAGNQTLNGLSQWVDSRTNPGRNDLLTSLQGIGSTYNNLLQNPDSFYNTNIYKSAFNQGQNAVNSTLAAQGLNASGNQLAALQQYGQTFGANQYNQYLGQVGNAYNQALSANQQSYSQFAGLTEMGLQQNQAQFNQLAQLSGLSSGSPTAAAAAQAQVYSNAGQAGTSIGTGIGQLANGLSGLGGSGSGSYNFDTGLGTTSGVGTNQSYNSGVYGVGGGVSDSGYNYSGGNSWGFTE